MNKSYLLFKCYLQFFYSKFLWRLISKMNESFKQFRDKTENNNQQKKEKSPFLCLYTWTFSSIIFLSKWKFLFAKNRSIRFGKFQKTIIVYCFPFKCLFSLVIFFSLKIEKSTKTRKYHIKVPQRNAVLKSSKGSG